MKKACRLIMAAAIMAGMSLVPAFAEEEGGHGKHGEGEYGKHGEGERGKHGKESRHEGEKGERGKEFPGCRRDGGDGGKDVHEKLMGYLASEKPEQLEELKKLRQEKPEEFKEKIRNLANEAREKFQKEQEEFKGIVDNYRKTQSPEDKAKIRARLEERFKKQCEMEKKRMEELEKHLKATKERYEKREKGKKEMIDSKLDEIVKDPDLKW